jgi:hypothetical protein
MAAEYNVHVTEGPMHEPSAGFYIVFPGGIAVALEVIAAGPGKTMVALVDANTAPIADDPSVTRELPAVDVAGTPLADRAVAIVDAAMSEDPRLRAFAARGDEASAHAVWSRRRTGNN